jgi:uncharacterized coiled-coil DUF342 family protein
VEEIVTQYLKTINASVLQQADKLDDLNDKISTLSKELATQITHAHYMNENLKDLDVIKSKVMSLEKIQESKKSFNKWVSNNILSVISMLTSATIAIMGFFHVKGS